MATTFFGTNGIRLDPSRTHVYFTVSGDLIGRAWVYRLPLVGKAETTARSGATAPAPTAEKTM